MPPSPDVPLTKLKHSLEAALGWFELGLTGEALRELDQLPEAARDQVSLAQDWQSDTVQFDAVLHHGASADVPGLLRALAERPGPIVGLVTLAPGDAALPLERLLIERSLSINTAAAGGNASLIHCATCR